MNFKKTASAFLSVIILAAGSVSVSASADYVNTYDNSYSYSMSCCEDYEADTAEDYICVQQLSNSSSTEKTAPKKNTGKTFLICLLIGLISAAIVVGSMYSSMKTVRQNTKAADYQKQGSLKINSREDIFLYKKIEKEAIQRSNTNS